MAPKTRSVKATKTLKENIVPDSKPKIKSLSKILLNKTVKTVLADKTNSASDENETMHEAIKKPFAVKSNKNEDFPRPHKRVPSRFVNKEILVDSTSKNNTSIINTVQISSKQNKEITKPKVRKTKPTKVNSPSKVPQKNPLDLSLITSRPKRLHRLPIKYDDHSMSPSKFIPVQPFNTSTPLCKKNKSVVMSKNKSENVNIHNCLPVHRLNAGPKTSKHTQIVANAKKQADKNNNPKSNHSFVESDLLIQPNKNKGKSDKIKNESDLRNDKITSTNFSYRISEKKNDSLLVKDKLAVYEFTYDPSEEPPPQRKKRKRTVKKKSAPKPKIYKIKGNYDDIVSKTLENLKSQVIKKTTAINKDPPVITVTHENNEHVNKPNTIENNKQNIKINPPTSQIILALSSSNLEKTKKQEQRKSNLSVTQLSPTPDFVIEDADYSPVQTPQPTRPQTPALIHSMDASNLQDDLSIVDLPIASSSLNVSKHPPASPWRVNIDIPLKYPVNIYVKPNMTPAFESSFIDEGDANKKKHVYTNILTDTSEPLPHSEIKYINDPTNWKQTSIISFIKEVAEKNLTKKRSTTPTKENSIFDESVVYVDSETGNPLNTPRKSRTPDRTKSPASTSSKCPSRRKSRSVERTPLKRKNENLDLGLDSPLHKTPRKDDVNNCFGFDDYDDSDTENIAPHELVNLNRIRALKTKSRAVLQPLMQNHVGPSRATLPRVAKSKFGAKSEDVKKIYEKMKSKEPGPLENKCDKDNNNDSDTMEENRISVNNEDSQSRHLFDEVNVVHHLKPNRKSYSKAKKVTFLQPSTSIVQDGNDGVDEPEDDSVDQSFKIPIVKVVKKTAYKKKVQKLSKKEEEEAETWAKNFNSMCADVDDFPLVVD